MGICSVLGKINSEHFNPYAKEAILWTEQELNNESFAYINTFEIIYEENNFICVHGSLQNPVQFNYIRDNNAAIMNFNLFKQKICFIGHSHTMEIYSLGKNGVMYCRDKKINVSRHEKYIINVGSVGQPRDGDPRSCSCIYDTDTQTVSFNRLEYDINGAAKKIIKQGLPDLLASRLHAGR